MSPQTALLSWVDSAPAAMIDELEFCYAMAINIEENPITNQHQYTFPGATSRKSAKPPFNNFQNRKNRTGELDLLIITRLDFSNFVRHQQFNNNNITNPRLASRHGHPPDSFPFKSLERWSILLPTRIRVICRRWLPPIAIQYRPRPQARMRVSPWRTQAPHNAHMRNQVVIQVRTQLFQLQPIPYWPSTILTPLVVV